MQHLGPGLSSTSVLNLTKDRVWKCLVLLYKSDFNIRNNERSNRNKKLMLDNGKAQYKKKVFCHGCPNRRVNLW